MTLFHLLTRAQVLLEKSTESYPVSLGAAFLAAAGPELAEAAMEACGVKVGEVLSFEEAHRRLRMARTRIGR